MSLDSAKKVLTVEAKAVAGLAGRIGPEFVRALDLILACRGKVIVAGMGKSGIIARKIAATLASTGTPAFFVHPAEGVHGDVGMVSRQDAVILVSNSGETEELSALMPVFKRLGVPVIGLLGNTKSSLAKSMDVVLDVGVSEEACPHQLTPTASTAAAMAMGDALAIALFEKRGFSEDDFAMLHPAGTLGKKMLLLVEDIMHTGDELPVVSPDAAFKEVIFEMSSKMLGHAAVIENGKVIGVITDGDLRRAMEKEADLLKMTARHIMSKNPRWTRPEELAAAALKMMERHSITGLLVCDDHDGKNMTGFIHLHDLLRAGVV